MIHLTLTAKLGFLFAGKIRALEFMETTAVLTDIWSIVLGSVEEQSHFRSTVHRGPPGVKALN